MLAFLFIPENSNNRMQDACRLLMYAWMFSFHNGTSLWWTHPEMALHRAGSENYHRDLPDTEECWLVGRIQVFTWLLTFDFYCESVRHVQRFLLHWPSGISTIPLEIYCPHDRTIAQHAKTTWSWPFGILSAFLKSAYCPLIGAKHGDHPIFYIWTPRGSRSPPCIQFRCPQIRATVPFPLHLIAL